MTAPLEMHWPKLLQCPSGGSYPCTVSGSWSFKPSTTLDIQIKALGLSIDGPAFAANEWARLYIWRPSGAFFTFMLDVAPGTPRNNYAVLGDSGMVIPANEDYCVAWYVENLSVSRYLFSDAIFEPF